MYQKKNKQKMLLKIFKPNTIAMKLVYNMYEISKTFVLC